MNFSFRYFTAFVIFIGLVALVGKQVLLENGEPFAKKLIDNINPFWNINAIQTPEQQNFSHTFNIEITNNTSENKIISGKIFLSHQDGTPMKNIGLINVTHDNPGNLVDYLPINPLGENIPSGESKIFNIEWKGFGDKYLDNKKVVITFTNPLGNLQNPDNFFPSFYQKLIREDKSFPLTIKKEITIPGQETQISEENISIPYSIFVKKINTGLIVAIGLILILLLIFSKILSRKTDNTSEQTLQEIKEFEKGAKEILNNLPVKKKFIKKIPAKKYKQHQEK